MNKSRKNQIQKSVEKAEKVEWELMLCTGKRILIPKAALESWLSTSERYQKNKD